MPVLAPTRLQCSGPFVMESGLVNTEDIISHRFKLSEIHRAIEVMGQPERNKVMIQI